MCRFTLYLGPSIRMSSLVTEPRNSLIHQSFESQEREEPLNGDGFGVAWYTSEHEEEPALFRSITPAWNNANLHSIARVVKSHCILAHVRAATRARSVSEDNCHPFTWSRYAFMHNGDLGGFSALRRPLLETLSDEAFDAIHGGTDSEHLFALFVDERRKRRSRRAGPEGLAQSLERAIGRALELSRRLGKGEPSFLNLAVSDGECAIATRFASLEGHPGESLYLHRGRRYVCDGGVCRMVAPERAGGAVIVSSERLSDDPGWEAIPGGSMVLISAEHEVTLRPLRPMRKGA